MRFGGEASAKQGRCLTQLDLNRSAGRFSLFAAYAK